MKNKQKYIDKAIQEILHPEFAVTKQYLEVCEIEIENGLPKIARISENYIENRVIIYFAVKKDEYFIEVYLTKKPEIEVVWVSTESGHRVYLTATSEELTFEELSNFVTKFKPLRGWSKGDLRENGKSNYNFSRASFEPIENITFSLEEKLNLLLTDLEKDAEGVNNLSKNSNAYISVCRYQYISGNGEILLDIETINRLKKLNLGIKIDTYIVGELIK